MRFAPFIVFVALVFNSTHATAQYEISGRVNLDGQWQPKVYLAAVNKLNDYYRTSPDMIVNTATVAADGSFRLAGDNLPDEKRFYRLYTMKVQNTDYDACLYVGGDDHNFVHLVMQNGEQVEIHADSSARAPFGGFNIIGSAENQAMRQLSGIVYPSFYFYRIKFPTELKFSEDRFHQDVRNFADSSTHLMPALAAVNNMDWDVYFDQDRAFFERFGTKLESQLPHSSYTKNYLSKLRYYGETEAAPSMAFRVLVFALLAALFASLLIMWRQGKRLTVLRSELQQVHGKTVQPGVLEQLTQKEREILDHIRSGHTNKEIASALFIEVSTVKTHINKLYSKIGASNRAEAKHIGDQLLS